MFDSLLPLVAVSIGILFSMLQQLLFKRKGSVKTVDQRINNLSNSLQNSLQEAATLTNKIEKEMKRKHDAVEKLKDDIEKYNKLADLGKSKAEAISQLLREEIKKGEKRSFWKNVAINFTFFVLGAIVTILLMKIL